MRDMQRGKQPSDRCGARTRSGRPCKAKGYGKGGRCRNHGGMSTGARTPEGRAKLADVVRARWARWRADRELYQAGRGEKVAMARLVRKIDRVTRPRLVECRSNPAPPTRKVDNTSIPPPDPFLFGFGDDDEMPHIRGPAQPERQAEPSSRPDFRGLDSGIAIDEPEDDYWQRW